MAYVNYGLVIRNLLKGNFENDNFKTCCMVTLCYSLSSQVVIMVYGLLT